MPGYLIAGYESCPYLQSALQLAAATPGVTVERAVFEQRADYSRELPGLIERGGVRAKDHTTCPLILDLEAGENKYVGGFSDFEAVIRSSRKRPAPQDQPAKRTKTSSTDDVEQAVTLLKSLGYTVGAPSGAARIFISGNASQVGKSSVCLGLLGSLLELGYRPEDIAYIKPATQCESPQLVAKFCVSKGIECVPVGPIVFYSGFTREFLKGNTDSTATMLQMVTDACDKLAAGKRILIVDGVGYPAVGSIVGCSNADVAKAARASVVLVEKKGVGDAVDAFNLDASFFECRGVRVLGSIHNRLPLSGYYALDKCKEAVELYFAQNRPSQPPYGFVPELPELVNASPAPTAPSTDVRVAESAAKKTAEPSDLTPADSELVELLRIAFMEHVDVKRLILDASAAPSPAAPSLTPTVQEARGAAKSRAEIQAAAVSDGASGG